MNQGSNRRDFLKTSSLAGFGMLLSGSSLVAEAQQRRTAAPKKRHRAVRARVLDVEVQQRQDGEVVGEAKAIATSKVLPLPYEVRTSEDVSTEDDTVEASSLPGRVAFSAEYLLTCGCHENHP